MISPVDLVKRVCVGGRLVPFFKCVGVYFVSAGGGGGGGGSPGAACVKCAPVACLVVLVALHVHHLPTQQGAYGVRVCVGLLLSALGDALLLWPQHFTWGMVAFAGAHLAYLDAFARSPGPLAPRSGAALYAATALFVSALSPPGVLRVLVPVYGALLATMAWRGAARGGRAAAGALLFLASDGALAASLWGGADAASLLVMPTYYLAQLGLALSALHPAAPPLSSASVCSK